MQRKRRIYEWNWAYSFLKPYVMLMYRLSYGRREYHGLEKIPVNQPIIYAPNHTSALMDAMSVLDIDTSAKVFVARADIFKNKFFAKILFFLRIMPIHRIRDGRNSLKNNDEIIQESVEVLRNNVPFVIAPEGTHRPMHNLLPLGKGIFRIALLANEELNKPQQDSLGTQHSPGTPENLGPSYTTSAQPGSDSARQVHIVPVGLEYGHFFRYRTSLLCQIGDPINVTQYVADNPDKEHPVLMNELKDLLEEGLKELILYIPDDDDYTATWELCGVSAHHRIKQMGLCKRSLKDRLQANRQTVQLVLEKKRNSPRRKQTHAGRNRSIFQKTQAKTHQHDIGSQSGSTRSPTHPYSTAHSLIPILCSLHHSGPTHLVSHMVYLLQNGRQSLPQLCTLYYHHGAVDTHCDHSHPTTIHSLALALGPIDPSTGSTGPLLLLPIQQMVPHSPLQHPMAPVPRPTRRQKTICTLDCVKHNQNHLNLHLDFHLGHKTFLGNYKFTTSPS